MRRRCSANYSPFEPVQALERRFYFAGPSLDPIPDQTVPVGKSIQIPLTATDANGDPLTYTISDNKAAITTDLHPATDTWLQLSTTQGTMLFELFNDVAPNTVATMKGLVESGFFNGLTFHRIVKDFVVQGGDPKGNGSGGPGFAFDDEFDPNTIFSGSGQLAMANSGKDTNGSQFFITDGPQRFLDFNHTIWGQLVRGFSTFNKLLNVPLEQQPGSSEISKPVTTQKIKSATIVADTTDAVLQVNTRSKTTGQVTVQVTDAHGGTSEQTINIFTQADTTDDPPILLPVADQFVGKNKTLTFKLNSIDPDGGDVEYGDELVDTLHGSASVAGDVVTFVPAKNYVGPVDLVVGVKTEAATTRGSLSQSNNDIIYDTQKIRIAVGDRPASGQALPLNVTTGSTLTNVALATFTDSDPTGTAANWSAAVTKDSTGNSVGGINWGDDTITSGMIVANANGTFSVTGSHTYPFAGDYPISITVNGDKGAQVVMNGTVHVADMSALAAGVLTVNGTAGDDTIGISETAGQIHVNVNGTILKYDGDDVRRCEIYAGAGNDTVTIGAGVPGTYIDGADGNDLLIGGDANDTLAGGAGKNTLSGANGDDRLNGSGGRDLIYGGNGADRIYGNGGDDTLDGGNGVDRLFGGNGDDQLIGGGSNDKLYGEAGNDKFNGGAGADFEDGGLGTDSAVGDALDTNVNIEKII